MKIVNFLGSGNHGEIEQAFVNYTEMLVAGQHTVIIVTNHDLGLLYLQRLQQLQIPIHQIHNYLGHWDYPLIYKLRCLFKQERPDLILAHSSSAISLAKRAAKQLVPVVAINHDYHVLQSLQCDLILTLNSAIRDQVLALNPQQKKSTHVIGNMLSKIVYQHPVSANLDLQQGLKIGFLGTLDQIQRPELILRAVANLPSLPCQLLIAGEGPLKTKLQQLIQQLHLEQRVTFLGCLEDSYALFQQTNVFCSTASIETFGLATLEAMYYRQIIVATDTDSSREIINPSRSGMLIANRSETAIVADLSNAFSWLLQHPTEAQEMANNAKLDVEKYTRAKISGRLMQLFNETITSYTNSHH